MDWTQIGTIAGAVISSAISYIVGRGKRKVANAADGADISALNAAASQVKALLARVEALEKSHAEMWSEQRRDKALIIKLQMRQAQLEGILRQHDIPVPAWPDVKS